MILAIGVNNLAPLVYTGTRMIPDGVRMIQIDAGDHELGKTYPAEVAILADPRSAIQELIEALVPFATGAAAEMLDRRREMITAHIAGVRAKFAENASMAISRRADVAGIRSSRDETGGSARRGARR